MGVLSQTMFLKAIRGFISVSRRRELSTLLEFFNLVQYENQWRNSQFYYLRPDLVRQLGKGQPSIESKQPMLFLFGLFSLRIFGDLRPSLMNENRLFFDTVPYYHLATSCVSTA